MQFRATCVLAIGTLLALTPLAYGGDGSVHMDGARQNHVQIHGTVAGISGSLPVEPVTVATLGTASCNPPSCSAFRLVLTLKGHARAGDFLAAVGSAGANLGITMRLLDNAGATVASTSTTGHGVTTTGLQEGQVLRAGRLLPGRYELRVFAVAGSTDFTGDLRWS